MQIRLDASKFYIGKLCLREHDHEGTGGSFRLKSNRGCYECSKIRPSTKAWIRRRRGIPEPTTPEPDACECCGRAEPTRALAIDHDHETGKFRGWLCTQCNTGLGKFGDNTEGLKKALDYLERAALQSPPRP